jgi:uncharacterized membrane protein
MGPGGFIGGILGIAVGFVCFVIAFILALLAVKYVRNCLHALAARSGENLFRTAGTLIWIGAILMIIGVGAILMWIDFIIMAIRLLYSQRHPTATIIRLHSAPTKYAVSFATASIRQF